MASKRNGPDLKKSGPLRQDGSSSSGGRGAAIRLPAKQFCRQVPTERFSTKVQGWSIYQTL